MCEATIHEKTEGETVLHIQPESIVIEGKVSRVWRKVVGIINHEVCGKFSVGQVPTLGEDAHIASATFRWPNTQHHFLWP
jgi:hypothetical protein